MLIQVNISCKAYIFYIRPNAVTSGLFLWVKFINRMNIDCIPVSLICVTQFRLYVHVQTRMGSLTYWMYISDEQTINNLL